MPTRQKCTGPTIIPLTPAVCPPPAITRTDVTQNLLLSTTTIVITFDGPITAVAADIATSSSNGCALIAPPVIGANTITVVFSWAGCNTQQTGSVVLGTGIKNAAGCAYGGSTHVVPLLTGGV